MCRLPDERTSYGSCGLPGETAMSRSQRSLLNRPSPPNPAACRRSLLFLVAAAPLFLAGCTSFSEYVHNGFKVGPNYRKPAAPVASEWIDSKSQGVNVAVKDLAGWWTAFNDPKLNELVDGAYRQNLDLR